MDYFFALNHFPWLFVSEINLLCVERVRAHTHHCHHKMRKKLNKHDWLAMLWILQLNGVRSTHTHTMIFCGRFWRNFPGPKIIELRESTLHPCDWEREWARVLNFNRNRLHAHLSLSLSLLCRCQCANGFPQLLILVVRLCLSLFFAIFCLPRRRCIWQIFLCTMFFCFPNWKCSSRVLRVHIKVLNAEQWAPLHFQPKIKVPFNISSGYGIFAISIGCSVSPLRKHWNLMCTCECTCLFNNNCFQTHHNR